MSKVAKTEKKELQVKLEVDHDLLSLLPRAESSDFDIARLILVQPTSKIEGSPGDVLDSSTREKVAGLDQKLVFVPIWFFKDFAITEVETKKFRRNEPKTPDNAHYSVFDNRLGTDPDGVSVKRDERLNLFLVNATELDSDFPRLYRMVMKPSSFKEAKKLLSEWDIQVRTALRGGPMPFSYLWAATPKVVISEQGKYYIYELSKVMNISDKDGQIKQAQINKDQLTRISYWVKTLAENKDKVAKVVDVEATESTEAIPF